MAEGIMKKFYGSGTYVQSAGVKSDLDIDGFSVAVCREIGVELERHRTRSFDEIRHHSTSRCKPAMRSRSNAGGSAISRL